MSLPQFHRSVFLAAVVAHLITAWFSTGYYSADEHFQIIAFAQAKLGELPLEHLPWEYDAGIRSSLQPWVAVAAFKALSAVGLYDPFFGTFCLRLLTALLALLAVHRFVSAVQDQLPVALRRSFLLLSYFLWFLPFLHVRFSSEGWSGIFLLIGLAELLRPVLSDSSRGQESRWNHVRAGLAFGVAALCRPPVGLIVICALAWSLYKHRTMRHTLFALGAFGVIQLLGYWLDSAFYLEPTLSVWNYVKLGFTGDPTHRFDELPWYYYAPWVVKYAIPPIGIAIVSAFVALLWKRPGHVLVWIILPFLLVHSFIPHKELRFLFPLADLIPLLLITAYAEVASSLPFRILGVRMLVAFLLVANLLGLSVVMSSPAGVGRTRLAEELIRSELQGQHHITYVIDPAQAWRISLPDFYLPDGFRDSAFVVATYKGGDLNTDLLVATTPDATFIQARGAVLEPIGRSDPQWAETLMRWYTWGEGPPTWWLFQVRRDR